MNTRLQVEHPVTELITASTWVELMIRVAAGGKLPFQQKDVKLQGWAVEARLYAEDPFRNFLPSTGACEVSRARGGTRRARRYRRLRGRRDLDVLRSDDRQLCTHGHTRDEAIDRMRRALDEFYVRGVSHNVPFLAALMAHPRFRAGKLTTNFIAEEFKGGFTAEHLPPKDPAVLAAVAAVVDRIHAHRAGAPQSERVVMLNRSAMPVSVSGGGLEFAVDNRRRRIEIESDWAPGEPLMRAKVDQHRLVVQIDPLGSGWRLTHEGGQADVLVLTPRQAELYALMPVKAAPDTSKFLLSPMRASWPPWR